jgi:hypothetical protein
MWQRWLALSLCLVVLFAGGCGPQSNRQVFIADQAGTVTPHGPIAAETVEDSPDGVTYRTRDGRKWQVKMETRPDGRTSYGEPQLVSQ